jgi:hypothetical protein
VQRWIETGNPESVHPGVRWLIDTWMSAVCPKRPVPYRSIRRCLLPTSSATLRQRTS